MMFKKSLYLFFAILSLSVGLAFPQATPDKSEADYQKFIKDQINQKRLIIEYDKFKKITTIRTAGDFAINELQFRKPDGNLPDGAGNFLFLDVIGIVPDNPSAKDVIGFGLHITSHTFENWKYLNCQELNWLVDEKPLSWLSENYSSETGQGTDAGVELYEYFSILLNQKQFEHLVNSKNIDFEICKDEFVFNEKQYWVMRWISEQVKEIQKNNKTKKDE